MMTSPLAPYADANAYLWRPAAAQSIGGSPPLGASPSPLLSSPPSLGSWALIGPSGSPVGFTGQGDGDGPFGSDRLAQALAELALQGERDQFPIDIVMVPGTRETVRTVAARRIGQLLGRTAGTSALTRQSLDPYYEAQLARLSSGLVPSVGGPSVPVPALPEYDIEPAHLAFDVVDVRRTISTGTAQGTVYDVDVIVPPADVARLLGTGQGRPRAAALGEPHAALVRQPGGRIEAVHAALKKSPIYQVGLWLALATMRGLIERRAAAAQQIAATAAAGGAGGPWFGTRAFRPARRIAQRPPPPSQTPAMIAAWFQGARRAVANAGGPTLSLDFVGAPLPRLEASVAELEAALQREYDDPNNDAYIDAVGAFLGSQLAVAGISPFFGFLYGTLRARDTAFFAPDSEPVRLIGPHVNEGFPVQATIMQFLDGTLGSLIGAGFFRAPGGAPGSFDYRKAMALAAQVVFGLATAQAAYGIVHNDFHNDNVAFENVDEGTVLYYAVDARPSSSSSSSSSYGGERYYAVPTFGKVYKMIDFGRATFRLGGESWAENGTRGLGARRRAPLWGSPTQDQAVGGGWNLRGRNNDLLRFVSTFLLNSKLGPDAVTPSGVDPWRDAFARMVARIVSCPSADSKVGGPMVWAEECLTSPAYADAAAREDCYSRAFSVRPYLVGSPCVNAVPSDNVRWFDDLFGIDPSEIPPGAHVYRVPA
jgi:hypothetical protein